jgi:hypothetical protein
VFLSLWRTLPTSVGPWSQTDSFRVLGVISRRVRLAGALVVALAVTVVGCGGGGGARADAAKVKQTVRRALTALADGNGRAFCALATAGAQAELARTIPGARCPQVVRTISHQLSPRVKLGLRHASVGTVTINGDHASIRDGDITSTQGKLKGFLQASAPPTKLTRQANGTWKIAG